MLLLAVAALGLLGGCTSARRNVAVYLLADATGAACGRSRGDRRHLRHRDRHCDR
ncbi:MAG: hypothetical protein R2854_09335 [Caldilineaceae bacterium]